MDLEVNNTKICFYARAGQLKLYVSIAKLMSLENIDFCFVTQCNEETKYIKKQLPNAKIYEIERFLEENWGKFEFDGIANLSKKYVNNNLWRLFYTDRFLVNYDYDDAVKFIIGHFAFYEYVFEHENPNFFLNEAIAIFSAYVAYCVGEQYSCKYIGTIIARDNSEEQFFFHNDPFQRNLEMEKYYRENNFSDEEIGGAKKYLQEFRNKEEIPAYMQKHKKHPHFKLKYLLYPAKYIILKLSKEYRSPWAYMTYKQAFNDSFSPFIMWINYLLSKRYYETMKDGEKYFLFPLHFQPEASTLVCAEKYEKQLFAIDNIAKSIPINNVLYVKEHYACLGHREISFYKALKKYPNVRIINPYESIHKLIKGSQATIVLTNTTGFESILHNKKVFVLGEVFYDFFENVVKIKDIYDECDKLVDVDSNVTDDKIIRFICSYKKSLKYGTVYASFPPYLSEENIQLLTKQIIERVSSN